MLDAFVLRPSPEILHTPAELGYDYITVTVEDDAGEQISLWHVPARGTRKGIFVVVPGDDANKGRYTESLPMFCDKGWDVILMDYEGYGESSGTASLEGLIRSASAVFRYAKSKSDVVVGYGASLGAPVLIRVAVDAGLTACVFESTVNIWREGSAFVEKAGLLGPPVSSILDVFGALLSSKDFDSLTWIAQINGPKLFIHSFDDHITPFPAAWELYQAAPDPKYFYVTQGDHSVEPFLHPDQYRLVVNGWLDGVLGIDRIDNPAFDSLIAGDMQTLTGLGLLPTQ